MATSREERAALEAGEKAKKHLEEMSAKGKPMTTVVLDGEGAIAYFVARGSLDIEDTVVAVPFTKLLILLGQLCVSVIAPLFAGQVVTQRHGGDEKKKGNIHIS